MEEQCVCPPLQIRLNIRNTAFSDSFFKLTYCPKKGSVFTKDCCCTIFYVLVFVFFL